MQPDDSFDREMMANALRVARRGLGRTGPNPAVGAVVVDPATREIVARGWTQPGGRPHAETEALARAGARASGASLYVTLEPCAHHGMTPPCADAIVAAGVARVVAATRDPDPRTSGQGIARLRAAGIAVTEGVGEVEARRLAAGHILRITEARPFVELKLALAADGSVPEGRDGAPVWATGPEARAAGHLLRAEADAILVGIGTVLADDPALTCRLPGLAVCSPDRVIVDARLRIPETARALPQPNETARVWIATAVSESERDRSSAWARGALVLTDLAGADGRIDLDALLHTLAANGIRRLLVEGGPTVWRAFADAGLVDEVVLFIAGRDTSEANVRAALAGCLGNLALELSERRGIGSDTMWRLWSPRFPSAPGRDQD